MCIPNLVRAAVRPSTSCSAATQYLRPFPRTTQRSLCLMAPARPQLCQSSLLRPVSSTLVQPAASQILHPCQVSLNGETVPQISAHPALASIQLRFGPRNTFRPSHLVRKRRSGFLSRLRTRKGRATLRRRQAKGRTKMSH